MPVYNYTTLDDPSAFLGRTTAWGINGAGQIVGRWWDASYHGFLLSGGTYTTLDDPSAKRAGTQVGINDAGQIVGYYDDGKIDRGGDQSASHRYLPLL
jgi:hypothetical protein